jgi:putative aldouronate transport system permease protein
MKIQSSTASRLFDVANYTLLLAMALLVILPFIHVINVSLSGNPDIGRGGLIIAPREFSTLAYQYLLSSQMFVRSMGVTVYITVVGTFVNVLLTVLMAYSLSKKRFKGRTFFTVMVLVTLFFNAGILPHYLVVKSFGMINSFWALIIPSAVSGFNLILMKSFFQNIPEELEESAKIDGANDWVLLWQIAIPLSMSAIATFTLFYSVQHWNSFLQAVLYMNDPVKWPIQVLLRQIVSIGETDLGGVAGTLLVQQEAVKSAAIILVILPIVMVYPLLQKHFAKGVMLGSVKG